MCHTCFRHMTSICKNYKPMKEQFLHDFHYQIVRWKVYNDSNKKRKYG